MDRPVLLSTAYFPPVSWFALAIKSKAIILEAHETYPKQTYRNRCNILGPNGLQPLIIPVSKPFGNRTKINEVIITPGNNWKRLHWRALEAAYNNSPFFLYYRDRIEKILFQKHSHLLGLNQNLINLMFEFLGIQVQISTTESFLKESQEMEDFREAIHPKRVFPDSQRFPDYTQVFNTKFGFIPDLSILDLLFNEGPASIDYLGAIAEKSRII